MRAKKGMKPQAGLNGKTMKSSTKATVILWKALSQHMGRARLSVWTKVLAMTMTLLMSVSASAGYGPVLVVPGGVILPWTSATASSGGVSYNSKNDWQYSGTSSSNVWTCYYNAPLTCSASYGSNVKPYPSDVGYFYLPMSVSLFNSTDYIYFFDGYLSSNVATFAGPYLKSNDPIGQIYNTTTKTFSNATITTKDTASPTTLSLAAYTVPFTVTSQPSTGTVSISGSTLTYTPTVGTSGNSTAVLSYTFTAGGATVTKTVSIDIVQATAAAPVTGLTLFQIPHGFAGYWTPDSTGRDTGYSVIYENNTNIIPVYSTQTASGCGNVWTPLCETNSGGYYTTNYYSVSATAGITPSFFATVNKNYSGQYNSAGTSMQMGVAGVSATNDTTAFTKATLTYNSSQDTAFDSLTISTTDTAAAVTRNLASIYTWVTKVEIASNPAFGTASTDGTTSVTYTPAVGQSGTTALQFYLYNNTVKVGPFSIPVTVTLGGAVAPSLSFSSVVGGIVVNVQNPDAQTTYTVQYLDNYLSYMGWSNGGSTLGNYCYTYTTPCTSQTTGTTFINYAFTGSTRTLMLGSGAANRPISVKVTATRGSSTATTAATLSTAYVDSAPIANATSVTVGYQTANTFKPNFTDADTAWADSWTVASTSTPANGTVTASGSNFTYTPNAGFSGTDSFTYSVTDSAGGASSNTVTLTVLPPAPVTPTSISATQGTQATKVSLSWTGNALNTSYSVYRSLTSNDSNPALLASGITGTTYTDTTASAGTTYYYYLAGVNASGTSAKSLSVSGYADTAPSAASGSFTTSKNTPITFSPTWTDPEKSSGDAGTLTVSTQPAHGTVSIVGSQFTYTPTTGYVGNDSFTFMVTDWAGLSTTGTASGVVNPPPPVTPTAVNATKGSVLGQVNLTWTGSANDMTYNVYRSTSSTDNNPTLIKSGLTTTSYSDTTAASGTVYYYFVSGLNDLSTESSKAASVMGYIDTAPTTGATSFTANTGSTTAITANVVDPDYNETLTFTVLTAPAGGTVTTTSTGFMYTPTAGYYGSDSFTYQVTDKAGQTATGTVSGTVLAMTPNVAANITATKGTIVGKVNVGWSAATYASSYDIYRGTASNDPSPVKVGSVTGNSTTTFSDTTAAAGTTYWYFVKSVNVNVSANLSVGASGYADTPPSNASATFSGSAETTFTVTPTWTDPDPSESITLAVVTQPANGTVVVNGTTFKYTGNANFAGNDSFTFSVTDKAGASVTGTATGSVVALPPSVATGLTATQGTKVGKVALTWAAASNARTYNVMRSTTSGDPSPATIGTVNTTSFDDTNAQPGVTYYYWVQSVDLNQTAALSTSASGYADTLPSSLQLADFITPAGQAVTLTPTWVDPDPAETAAISISGSPSHGTASVVSGKIVYTPTAGYSGTDSFTWKVTDKAGGFSTATVNAQVVLVPSSIASITATKGTKVGEVDLSWSTSTNATSYIVMRGTSSNDPSPVQVGTSPTTSFADTTAAPGVTYWYSVHGQVMGVDGLSTAFVSGYADTPPSAASASFTAVLETATTFTPTWTDPDPSETGTLAITTQPAHGTVSISSGKFTYTPAAGYVGADSFTFSVTDKAGASVTGTASGTVDSLQPSLPTGVSATKGTKVGEVDIAWSASTNAKGYNILRSTTSAVDPNPQLIGTTTVPTTSYVDTNTDPGATYYYFVQATTVGKTSALSTSAMGYADTPPSAASASVTVNAEVASTFSGSWTDPDPSETATLAIVSPPSNGTVSIVSGQFKYTGNLGYVGADSFQFSVTDKAGASTVGVASITVTALKPATVTGVSATQGTKVGQVNLAWTAATNARGYTVLRGASAGDPAATVIGTSTSTSFVDTSAAPGVTYYYAVQSVDLDQLGDYSSWVSGYADTLPSNLVLADFVTATSTPIVLTPTWSDADPADPGTLGIANQPAHGTVTVSSGKLTYTPTSGYYGADSFTWKVTDKAGGVTTQVANATVQLVPAKVTGLTATQGTLANGVGLSWSAATNAAQYVVMRGNSAADPSPVEVGRGADLTYVDTSAAPGTKYYYFVYGTVSGIDGQASATVSGYEDTPPSAATASFNIAVNTSGTITPTWTDPDSGDTGAIAIVTQPANGTVSVAAGKFTYTPTTDYIGTDSFTFSVTDKAGASVTGTASGTVYAPTPSTPSSLVATQGTKVGEVDLSWTGSVNGRSYNIYRSLSSGDTVGTLLGVSSTNSYVDTTLPVGSKGYYWVVAVNFDKLSTKSTTALGYVDTPPSAASASFSATINTPQSFSATWTDPDSGDTAALAIESQPSNGIASVNAGKLVYVPNTDYVGSDSFTFSVTDKAGAKVVGTASGSVIAPMPAQVGSVIATQGSKIGEVDLSWSAAVDARSYEVLRGSSANDPSPVQIGSVTKTSFADSTAQAGVTYWYSVRSVAFYNKATPSTAVSGYADTPPSGVAAVINTTLETAATVTPTFTDPDAGDSGVVAILTQPAHGKAVASGTQIQYVPATGFVGTDSFTFSVTDKAGASASGTAVASVVEPAATAPKSVTATKGSKAGEVDIAWTAADNAKSYTVLRAGSANDPSPVSIATGVTSLSFVDTTVVAGQPYYYSIVSVVISNQSAPSTAVVGYSDNPPANLAGTFHTVVNQPISFLPTWTDADAGDVGTVAVVTQPAHGTAVMNQGKILYTPATDYIGSDSFTFSVTDKVGAVSSATATGQVDPGVPNAPANFSATNGTVLGAVKLAWSTTLGANQYIISRSTTSGDKAPQVIASTSDTSYNDTSASPGLVYYYTVKGSGAAGVGPSSVEVAGYADAAPTSTTVSLFTQKDTPVTAAPTVVSTDPTNTYSFQVVSQPAQAGRVSIDGTGRAFTLTPNSGYAGLDTFTYQVTDKAGATLTGTGNITVGCGDPTVGAVAVQSGKIFAGTPFTITSSYANSMCSTTLSATLTIKAGLNVIYQSTQDNLSPSMSQALSFDVSGVPAGTFSIDVAVTDKNTQHTVHSTQGINVASFRLPSISSSTNVVANLDVAYLQISPTQDCELTTEQGKASANHALCLVEVAFLPTGMSLDTAKSTTNLVWDGKVVQDGTFNYTITFSQYDNGGGKNTLATVNKTLVAASSSSILFASAPAVTVPQYFGQAKLVVSQSAGPSCTLTSNMASAMAAAAAGTRLCYVEFSNLPPANTILNGAVAVTFDEIGTMTIPWTVSTFDPKGEKLVLGTGQSVVNVRPNNLSFGINTGSVPPIAGVTTVSLGVQSLGQDTCSLTLVEATAKTTNPLRPCLLRWTSLPDGITQNAQATQPMLVGMFQKPGDSPISYTLSYFDISGGEHQLLNDTQVVTVQAPPLPDLQILAGRKVDADTYVVSANGGIVGTLSLPGMTWPLDMDVQFEGEDFVHKFQVPASGRVTLNSAAWPLWSVRKVTIKVYLRSASAFYKTYTYNVMSVPISEMRATIDKIPSVVSDTDKVAVSAHMIGQIGTQWKYDASVEGQWNVVFGVIDGSGNFVAMTDPILTDENGNASGVINPFGRTGILVQARATPANGDSRYSVTVSSSATGAVVVKGTPVSASIAMTTPDNGKAPMISVMRIKYASVSDMTAAKDIHWFMSQDGRLTWNELTAQAGKPSIGLGLQPGHYSFKASVANKNTDVVSVTDPVDVTVWLVPKIALNGPTYAFVGTPTTIQAVVSSPMAGFPIGDTVTTWDVSRRETLSGGKIAITSIASGQGGNIQFNSDIAGLYVVTVKSRAVDSDETKPAAYNTLQSAFIYAPPRSPAITINGPAKVEVGKPITYTVKVATAYSLTAANQTIGGQWILPNGSTVQGTDPLVYTPTQEDLARSTVLTIKYQAWVNGYESVTTVSSSTTSQLWAYLWPTWKLSTSMTSSVSPTGVVMQILPPDTRILSSLDHVTYTWSVPDGMQVQGTPTSRMVASIPVGGTYTVSVTVSDARGNTTTQTANLATTNPAPYIVDVIAADMDRWQHAPVKLQLTTKTSGGHPLDMITSYTYNMDGVDLAVPNQNIVTVPVTTAGEHTITVNLATRMGATATKSIVVNVPPETPPTCTLNAQRYAGNASVVQINYSCKSPYGYIASYVWNVNGVSFNTSRPSTWLYTLQQGQSYPVTIGLSVTDDAGQTSNYSAVVN